MFGSRRREEEEDDNKRVLWQHSLETDCWEKQLSGTRQCSFLRKSFGITVPSPLLVSSIINLYSQLVLSAMLHTHLSYFGGSWTRIRALLSLWTHVVGSALAVIMTALMVCRDLDTRSSLSVDCYMSGLAPHGWFVPWYKFLCCLLSNLFSLLSTVDPPQISTDILLC